MPSAIDSKSAPLASHAVVLGGSMAGLFAARALSDRFERVTVLERDTLGSDGQHRKGVPQGRQFHALLKRGEQLADAWFPGFSDGLRRRGAVPVEMGPEFRWHHFGAWKERRPSGVVVQCLSRPEIEAELRSRVLALPNVRLHDGVDVTGLSTDDSRRRVTGVLIHDRKEGAASDETVIAADLVVDAMGRGSHTPKWLEAIGAGKPRESTVKVDVCYATRLFRRPLDDGKTDWKVLYVLGQAPETRRLGILAPIEGGRWMALMAGMLGDHPPSDPQGWMEFARSLPSPAIADALAGAEPLSDIVMHKFPSHLRRHYEGMKNFPDGFAVLGDSHCSFNPIYGQGMTTAALGAEALAIELAAAHGRGGLAGFSARFQRALAKAVNDPWMMSTSEDLRYPEVEGDRPVGGGFLNWYTARVHRAASRDPEVTALFYQAMHMLTPPTSLMKPSIAWRVLLRGGAVAKSVEPKADASVAQALESAGTT